MGIFEGLNDYKKNMYRAHYRPVDESRGGYGTNMSNEAQQRAGGLGQMYNGANDRGLRYTAEGDQAYGMQDEARQAQQYQLDQLTGLANGAIPTYAQGMAARQQAASQNAMMAQRAMALNPRAAAAAAYQGNAMGSKMGADIAIQGGQASMMERDAARQQAMGLAGSMRQGDQGVLDASLQQTGANDAYGRGLLGNRYDIYNQQLAAQLEAERMQQRNSTASQRINAGMGASSASHQGENARDLVGTVGGGMRAYAAASGGGENKK